MSDPRAAPRAIVIGAAASSSDGRVLIPTHGRIPERPPTDLIWEFKGDAMGHPWIVRLVPGPGHDREAIYTGIDAELNALTEALDVHAPRSEVSRFNAAPAGFYKVSDALWAAIDAAMDLADETDGAFDPTLGALTLSPSADEDARVEALTRTGWQGLRMNREARALRQVGGMILDLSSIARGWAVDRLSDALAQAGVAHHTIEFGGVACGRGVRPDARPWTTEIATPAGRTRVALHDVAMTHRTGAHLVRNRTGSPVEGDVSALVVADDAARADALATAFVVMGPDAAMAHAASVDLAAAVVTNGREVVSPAFQAMLDEGR